MISDLETTGGAAVAASRLASGLTRAGSHVTRIVNDAETGKHEWLTRPLIRSSSLPVRLRRWISSSGARDRLDRRLVKASLRTSLKELGPDIVNIHNLHRATHAGWDWEMLQTCAEFAPVVWTLHDMWSFTGRCAYSYTCRKFISGCDSRCPTPTEHPQLEPTKIAPAWQQRRKFFRNHPELVAVTPSRWMAQEAKAGLWKGNRVLTIPYGIDVREYYPIEQTVAREALGIAAPGILLFIAAEDLSDRRKGGNLLFDSLEMVRERPLTILTMGSGGNFADLPGISWHHLGKVDHPRLQTLAYSAADLFVHPAPVDNLPNVLFESIACGTPAVAFRTGGVPEIVRAGKTGWLADEITGAALAHTLNTAIKDLRAGLYLRTGCRKVAVTEYELSLQSERYLSLFEELISVNNAENGSGG